MATAHIGDHALLPQTGQHPSLPGLRAQGRVARRGDRAHWRDAIRVRRWRQGIAAFQILCVLCAFARAYLQNSNIRDFCLLASDSWANLTKLNRIQNRVQQNNP